LVKREWELMRRFEKRECAWKLMRVGYRYYNVRIVQNSHQLASNFEWECTKVDEIWQSNASKTCNSHQLSSSFDWGLINARKWFDRESIKGLKNVYRFVRFSTQIDMLIKQWNLPDLQNFHWHLVRQVVPHFPKKNKEKIWDPLLSHN
jgi:hypothetical protein